MAYGIWNGSVERIVAKLDSAVAQVRESGIDKRVFINDEEISSFGYRNGVLIIVTTSSEIMFFNKTEKLNLLISN